MNMRSALLTTTVLGGVVGLAWASVAAIEIADGFAVGGRFKQGVAIAYDETIVRGGGVEIGQMNYWAELTASWKPTNTITFTGDWWLRGDWYHDLGGDLIQPGIPDYTSPQYLDQFDYHLNEKGGGRPSGPLANPPGDPFGTHDYQNRYLSDFNDEVIREMAVKLTDTRNRYALKVGKFVRGWGQSDGLRLLDVLHAQDFRMKFAFGDSDEIRIPNWMVAAELSFDPLGLGEPFHAIGITKPKIELIYMPEYHHDQLVINNATPGDETSGGLYGAPYPTEIDKESGYGIPFFGAHLTNVGRKRFMWNDPTLAGRFQFRILEGEATLNALYAYQELPIVKFRGSHLVVGNALHDEKNATAVIPLDGPTTQTVVFGPGVGYAHFLRGPAPLLSSLQDALGIGAINPFGCTAVGVLGPMCSVNVQFDLDWRYRRKLVGGSYTRDMVELPMGPKDVAPVFRTEFSYEFDKPFNKSTTVDQFGRREEGIAAMVTEPRTQVTKKDQISIMTGFDYFLWVPFWKNQDGSIFTSFQLFTIITPHAKELVFQAPYSSYGSKLHKVQNYATFLFFRNFDNGRLYVEGLAAYDFQNKGWGIRQRFDFNYFGDHIRPRLEFTHFEGRTEQGVFGIFDHVDNVELSVTLQF